MYEGADKPKLEKDFPACGRGPRKSKVLHIPWVKGKAFFKAEEKWGTAERSVGPVVQKEAAG